MMMLVGRAGVEPTTNGLKEVFRIKNLYKSTLFFRCVAKCVADWAPYPAGQLVLRLTVILQGSRSQHGGKTNFHPVD